MSNGTGALAGARVEIVSDMGQWLALRVEWEELAARSPTAAPPLQWTWLHEWWRAYGPVYGAGSDRLRVLAVRQDSRLIGALPLYLGRAGMARRLQFLSTGEEEAEQTCAAYLDLLHLPGAEETCLESLRRALLEMEDWDELELSPLAACSPLRAWETGFPGAALIEERSCHVAELTGGFEAYLGRLSRSTRKEFRQLLREVECAGAEFTLAEDPASAGVLFDQLVALHQDRWEAAGKPGCFASPRFLEFNRSLAREWIPAGRAFLARLSLGGAPLALQLGFAAGDKFDAYVHAAKPGGGELPVRSPGNAVQLLLMQRLAERGITRYDQMMGPAGSYKERFATEQVPMVTLQVRRPTFRGTVQRVSDLLGKAARYGRRALAGG